MPHIQVVDICHTYKTLKGDSVCALAHVFLTVNSGEFAVIVGPSGCGKSTLLRIICGLIKPTSGSVLVDNIKVVEPLPKVGFVFQTPVLLKWRTVLGNVLAPVEFIGLAKKDYVGAAYELLARMGLQGFENKYPYELSGGMQQRVAIARALILQPHLLLMDEPFGALDALTRDQLNEELEKLWLQERQTVLFVTHDISEAIFLADKVFVFTQRPGRVYKELNITLERPRTLSIKGKDKFAQFVGEVYETMKTMNVH